VECDIYEKFKDDQRIFTVFPAIKLHFKPRIKFMNQNIFFHQYVDLLCKKLSKRVERLISLQTFSLFPCKMRKIQVLGGRV
jgi:hypothetical protein